MGIWRGLERSLSLIPCSLSAGTWCFDSQDPKCGPTHWKELAPACGGPIQSPINIDLRLVQQDSSLQPFVFQGYNLAPPVLLHMDTSPQNHLEMWGAGLPSPAYRAQQLHFHWGAPGHTGSEHSLDGKHYSMEMHVVHINTKYQSLGEAHLPDGLAVLAVLLAEQNQDNANFSAIVLGLNDVSSPGVSVNMTSTFPLASLLPGPLVLLHYYPYSGSLTTPGCEPTVLWTVFKNTVPIGHLQLAQFQAVPQAGMLGLHPEPLRDNFRPLQPLGGPAVPPVSPILAGVHGALLGLGLSLVLWQNP
uniref:Carbonic anhydrase n=1 Tax=Sciurus vulgaris TaxID=55149 RepID=A0A8D2B6M5_SCIVU